MVIVAAGVRPATAFLTESPIAVERSIMVNESLATNIPDVYAAGDVAGLSGIWPNAQKQGQIAGYNMCDVPMHYMDTFAIKNTVNFFDTLSLSVGQREPLEGDVVEIREDRNRYEKYIMHDDVVVGVLLQGDISGSGFWQYLIKNKIHVGAINKPVWKLSFADFYGVEKTGEYAWI
jgi:NAD(P)H-nitrite reductase large subunit